MKKIVVDTYGADLGAAPIIRGVAKALKMGMDFFPVLVGDSSLIACVFEDEGINNSCYEIIHTTDFITMDEPAMSIFGGRDESSMAMAYTRLKEDDGCAALLSAGSTGALLIGSLCRLGLAKGIKFPALASALPCSGDDLVCLVDCGANIDCTAGNLAQFARMGNVFCKCFCGIENPRVGLMSNGREKGKGTALINEAYDKIEALDLNFVGNLEGSDMVSGYADVIVTDGFSGNLLLKNTEAAGKAVIESVRALGLDAEITDSVEKAILKRFDFNSRGAATFLGTKKTVVKMHGCADENTTVASIDQILRLERAEFSRHIEAEMNK